MNTPALDDLLTPEQAAEWLQISVRDLAVKSSGRNPDIAPFKSGRKFVRFHPRTVIAQQAKKAGLSTELIAAMFGIKPKEKTE